MYSRFFNNTGFGRRKVWILFDLDDGLVIMKKGFGIVEVMVSIVVLGFMYVALSKLQGSNHDAFLRIRGRDGAVEVAQQVMEELRSKGLESIPSYTEATSTYTLAPITRSWERGLGGTSTVSYTPTVTISPLAEENIATSKSNYAPAIQHVVARLVDVKIEWNFKGSVQSIDMSGVIR